MDQLPSQQHSWHARFLASLLCLFPVCSGKEPDSSLATQKVEKETCQVPSCPLPLHGTSLPPAPHLSEDSLSFSATGQGHPDPPNSHQPHHTAYQSTLPWVHFSELNKGKRPQTLLVNNYQAETCHWISAEEVTGNISMPSFQHQPPLAQATCGEVGHHRPPSQQKTGRELRGKLEQDPNFL